MKRIPFLLLLLLPLPLLLSAQSQKIKLSEAIKIAQENHRNM
jgi:hypothetical protein